MNFTEEGGYDVCTIQMVAKRYWSQAIETFEIAQLDSDSTDVIVGSLNDLQSYASPAARPAILQRFEHWNQDRKSSSIPAATHSYPVDSSHLDVHYLNALINAWGWNTTPEEITELGKLCVSDECRSLAQRDAQAFGNERTFIVFTENSDGLSAIRFGFMPYGGIGGLDRMEIKIGQYAVGTVFHLDTRGHSGSFVLHVSGTLGAWMTEHGYHLIL